MQRRRRRRRGSLFRTSKARGACSCLADVCPTLPKKKLYAEKCVHFSLVAWTPRSSWARRISGHLHWHWIVVRRGFACLRAPRTERDAGWWRWWVARGAEAPPRGCGGIGTLRDPPRAQPRRGVHSLVVVVCRHTFSEPEIRSQGCLGTGKGPDTLAHAQLHAPCATAWCFLSVSYALLALMLHIRRRFWPRQPLRLARPVPTSPSRCCPRLVLAWQYAC